MNKFILLFILILNQFFCFSQLDENRGELFYEEAYYEILEMIEGHQKYNFKKAVFEVENAYFENRLDYLIFNQKINELAFLTNTYAVSNRNSFQYEYEDKETILKRASLFNILTDTVPILYQLDSTIQYEYSYPYTYDFNDIMGQKDWTQMFVSKLLAEQNGNCHSLPYLYKIVAEEMGLKANLAIAPNHIYIKHYAQKTGMYNVELTSASFPIDAWLMASGYIHLDAIRSGIYMDTLSEKQSLALCLFDLVKGYERKYGYDNNYFINSCIDKVIAYYPTCINGLLFKSELLLRELKKANEVNYKKLFNEYQNLIVKIHKLGYRKMPEEMYANWMLELKENLEKYENKNIINITTQNE